MLKSIIFLVKSFWATFIGIWRFFSGHTGSKGKGVKQAYHMPSCSTLSFNTGRPDDVLSKAMTEALLFNQALTGEKKKKIWPNFESLKKVKCSKRKKLRLKPKREKNENYFRSEMDWVHSLLKSSLTKKYVWLYFYLPSLVSITFIAHSTRYLSFKIFLLAYQQKISV